MNQLLIPIVLKLGCWIGRPSCFKCFRVIFSLKTQTIQFSFSFNLYFQQERTPKLPIWQLLMKSSVGVFDVTNRQHGFYNFQRYHYVVMFNSVAKSCALF